MKFYSEEKIAFYKQKAQFSLITSICFIVLAVSFFALTAFFINDRNIIAIKVIDGVLLSLSSCFLFYSIINVIKPCKRKMNHIYTVMHSSVKHLVCEVVDVKEIKTISKNVVAQQLFVKADNLELFINYTIDCAPKKFVIGSKIEVDVADSFIINEEEKQ